MKLKLLFTSLCLGAASAACAAPISLDYSVGIQYQRSTRWQPGRTDHNITTRTAAAGNNGTSLSWTRFYFKFQMPDFIPGFALTSGVLAITYRNYGDSNKHPLHLYGTDTNWGGSLRYHNAPRITTDLLTTLPRARVYGDTAYLDLTDYLRHFKPGEMVSFIFKSGWERTNWADGAEFFGQSLALNYKNPVQPPQPGNPGNPDNPGNPGEPGAPSSVPEPQSLILLALGLAAMSFGLRRRSPG
jgi:hypothetical protein